MAITSRAINGMILSGELAKLHNAEVSHTEMSAAIGVLMFEGIAATLQQPVTPMTVERIPIVDRFTPLG